MEFCNKKHLVDHLITNPDIPEDPPSLPYMTKKQIRRLVRHLMWHRCMDFAEEFRDGNRVYLVDSELDLEGIITNDVQRIDFQKEAYDLCDNLINLPERKQ